MRHLSASGVCGQLLHKIPILTPSLVGGRVLEIEVLLDVIRSEFNTGLFVGNGALRPNIPVA